jgi:hypothetical protein
MMMLLEEEDDTNLRNNPFELYSNYIGGRVGVANDLEEYSLNIYT